jgi:hypothetical protein
MLLLRSILLARGYWFIVVLVLVGLGVWLLDIVSQMVLMDGMWADLQLVMRSRGIGRDEALGLAKEKRGRIQPNKGFWGQLEIWGAGLRETLEG